MSEDKEITLAWLSSLRLKISYLLREIITEPDILDAFLTEKAMNIWAKAFTHETFDYEFNYEELEFLGDAVLHAIFPVYLFRRYPGLKKENYTSMNNHYMSKAFQPVIASRMGLGGYVRIGGTLDSNLKIDTDLFESFFGALYTIGNTIQDFYGYAVTTVMLEHLMQPLELDVDTEPFKTKAEQMFTRLGLGQLRENEIKLKGKIRLEVYLTDVQLQYLASQGIRMPALIANGEGGTKTSTSPYTYEQALQTLEKYGVNKAWVEERRMASMKESTWMKPYLNDLLEKLQSEGFDSFDIDNNNKVLPNSKGVMFQLVGIDSSKKKKKTILATHLVEADKRTPEVMALGRTKVVEKYLET